MMIDIVITTYNQFLKLKRAATLALRDGGVTIIIDNGSTDQTQEAFSKCQLVTYNRIENTKYPGVLKDAGIQQGKGEYFCVIDANDMISTTAMEQMERIVAKTAPNLVYSFNLKDGKPGKNTGKPPLPENVANLCIIKRQAYEEVGGYNGTLEKGVDIDLYKRLFVLGKCAHIPEFMYFYDTSPEVTVMALGKKLSEKSKVILREAKDGRIKAKLEKQNSRTRGYGSEDIGAEPG
jgi:glycosyltransferase involved in cell wall biosynthesis